MKEDGVFLDITQLWYGGRLRTWWKRASILSPADEDSLAVYEKSEAKDVPAWMGRVPEEWRQVCYGIGYVE
jgi:hypothetical protein